MPSPVPAAPSVSVVIATRNRRECLTRTLHHLTALPDQLPLVVVDNGSSDGSVECIARFGPRVETVALRENHGAAARTIGVERAATPFVAFSDDDSWWAPGALARATALLGAHERVALVAARVLVGPEERLDPVSAQMRHSPLPPPPGFPGPGVLGFLACGAVVRRSAYLEAGGFHPRYGVGGEEELLSLDLAAAGWGLGYAEEVIAHHHPAPPGDRMGRERTMLRNALWTTWLRWPPVPGAHRTLGLLRAAPAPMAAAAAGAALLEGLPWVWHERRAVPAEVRAALGALNRKAAETTTPPG